MDILVKEKKEKEKKRKEKKRKKTWQLALAHLAGASIIERIVDPVQSAFVPKRSIHDNILLAHEIMNKFHNMKSKKSWVAIKLDMEKAYDRVEWAFLFQTLTALGFHSKWVQLIKRARQPLNCKLGKQSMFPKQDVWH